jgi:hypothetical protein
MLGDVLDFSNFFRKFEKSRTSPILSLFKQTLGFGAVPGSVGDLRRATSGEGETEPKQIGEGAQDGTEPLDLPGNMATVAFRPITAP